MKIHRALCKLSQKAIKENIAEIAEAVAKPRYLCKECARASRKKKHLCEPVKLAPKK